MISFNIELTNHAILNLILITLSYTDCVMHSHMRN